MLSEEQIVASARPAYEGKDDMHDLSHVRRVLRVVRELGAGYPHDAEVVMLGAYLHGIVYEREEEIRGFLREQGMADERMERAVAVAWESQKEEAPATMEGKLLHDAHLLEGGRTFLITKSLVAGTARGQTLEETIRYIEERVLGRFRCALPEAQRRYEEKERFAREFLANLMANL